MPMIKCASMSTLGGDGRVVPAGDNSGAPAAVTGAAAAAVAARRHRVRLERPPATMADTAE